MIRILRQSFATLPSLFTALLVVSPLVLLISSEGRANDNQRHAQIRPLVEKRYDWKTIDKGLGLKREMFSSWHGSGHDVKRMTRQNEDHISGKYLDSLSRIIDLDPNHKLLGQKEWRQIHAKRRFNSYQMLNKDERLEFVFNDTSLRLKQTKHYEEKARGKLARILAKALKGKRATPETLQRIASKLAAEHPYLDNPFRVELLIADTKGLFPELAKWDFSGVADRSGTKKLPKRVQQVVEDVGYRAYAHANVLFSNHLYEDGVVMLDALIAAGLNPKNSRYVTTLYPFEKGVQDKVSQRGVDVAHQPYSPEKTRQELVTSIKYLLDRSDKNHAPILVFDDGGQATDVIASHFAEQLHRFRIVEITKAGERIAKRVLPSKLNVNVKNFRVLTRDQQTSMMEKYLSANSFDAASREQAKSAWSRIASYLRSPSIHNQGSQNALDGRVFGFAHYTYSDSRYKREVMTPLYTAQVNLGAFTTIKAAGMGLNNKHVTIIGGGAMGLNAGLELKDKGYKVTFVEPDGTTQKDLIARGFSVGQLKDSLSGRGLIIDMSGIKDLLTLDHIFKMDDGTHVVNGSSKDYPFDMQAFKALAERTPWKSKPGGQRSASYTFNAAGLKRTIHFPGDGFTICHGGKAQNVPLKKFIPEINVLFRLGVHALNDRPVTHYPFFGTPEQITNQVAQQEKQTLDEAARKALGR